MIAMNFKVFGQGDKVKITWAFASFFLILILGISFSVPDSVNFPSYIIPLITMAIANFFMKRYQGDNVTNHLASNGEEHTWGRTIVVSLIGLVLVLGIILSVGFLLPEEAL